MRVKLISYSQPTKQTQTEGLLDVQDLIAFCARVSNPSNQFNTETSEKLLRYLAKHKHWSPFEMASACLEVETTRDIARQLLRHRSFSFQEFSQRYADPTKELEFEAREARLQDPTNRQNSIPVDWDNEEHRRINEEFRMKQLKLIRDVKELYNWALDKGIAKEQARAILPEGNTISRLYVNGTLRSWIHFIELRSGNGTQQEHADLALAVADVIAKIFPLSKEYIAQE